ncbi:MAG: hypothetical protein M3457_17525, partial [Chloroflexota bacterium]|nr:hypothetical protein [Chloroflexota bacterium]
DTDTDGIPNVLDPDDNNNGVTDEEDPQSFPPSNGGGSSNPPSGQPSTSSGPSSTGTSNQAEPDLLIRALPVTGSGSLIEENQLPALLAAMTTLLGAAATLLLTHRSPTIGRTTRWRGAKQDFD